MEKVFQNKAPKIEIVKKDDLVFLTQWDRFFSLRKHRIVIAKPQIPKIIGILQECVNK